MLTNLIILAVVVIIMSLLHREVEGFDGYPLFRVRRNMSYDLRGDIPIPYYPVSPWYQPEVGPIYNRPLEII
jgi:hypothetical protein